MKSIDRLFKLANYFSAKYAQQGYGQQQEDIGTGEPAAVAAAVGTQIKGILAKKPELAGKVAYIQFDGKVNAPTFAVRNVDINKVEVYAGYDEPQQTKAAEASQEILNSLKTAIDAALVRFYKTPAGVKILKASGTPPDFVVSFKWKF